MRSNKRANSRRKLQLWSRLVVTILSLSLFSSLLFSLSAKANEIDSEGAVKVTQFEIMPLICVTNKVGDECQLKLNVKWQTDTVGDYCFYQNQKEITCWQQTNKAKKSILVKLVKSSVFSLKQKGLEKILIEQKVTLNYRQSDRYRRRLRSQWSIF